MCSGLRSSRIACDLPAFLSSVHLRSAAPWHQAADRNRPPPPLSEPEAVAQGQQHQEQQYGAEDRLHRPDGGENPVRLGGIDETQARVVQITAFGRQPKDGVGVAKLTSNPYQKICQWPRSR